ncbi:diguanylate cyclase [Acinetobacter wanghuae]|uniref:diguanylate cyclase n=1 Tax=Acinetobacter wanghuae TaxID=2662362 RepID=A0A5Q0P2N3_9GAMM|nr:diguanylate cyclase [Acinetobacter wanghuae]MQW91654.1 diguanylate cyclase [Acinetobacter wanghuae]QGA11006.1 diguanylate cyclase [Acinetobacter wanghuae]
MRLTELKQLQIDPETHAYLVISFVVLICCLIGIATRPTSYLALLWPANAALLAVFLRFPHLNLKGGWLGAFCAYLFADLLTGNQLTLTLFLTLANLISVIVSLFFIRYFNINYKYYNTGFTFIHLFGIFAFAGCLASAAFAVFTLPNIPGSFMTKEQLWVDFGLWWTGEMVNYILILPLILAFPRHKEIRHFIYNRRHKSYRLTYYLPILSVMLCVLLTHIFVGPGAMLYPLAALIWVALTYRLFSVTMINVFVVLLSYHSLAQYYLAQNEIANSSTFISIRIGLFMLALSPLILCIISQNRNELFKRVLYLANHDSLTRTMNRHFFFQEAELRLKQAKKLSFSVIMLDIDHFKRLNDQYGHHAGDGVLQQFVELVRCNLRSNDLFARIGGEEFVILLWDIDPGEAQYIAERIRDLVQKTPIYQAATKPLHITVSLGILHREAPQTQNLQYLINQADQALYRAKHLGRNQVVLAS